MKTFSTTKVRSAIVGVLLSLPVVAFAADPSTQTANQGIKDFSNLISTFTSTVATSLATLLLSAAMIAFFYGIVIYIWGARDGDSKKIESGNTFMKWSLLALFVMFSVYGIIRFGQQFICGSGGCDTTIKVPDIKFSPSTSGTGAGLPGGPSNPTGTGLPGGGVGTCGVPFASCTKNGVKGTCSADGFTCEVSSSGAGGVSCDSSNEATVCGDGQLCNLTTNKCETIAP